MLRILFVVPSLNHGGSERVTATLATGLQQAGCQVGVLTFTSGGEYRTHLHPAVTCHYYEHRVKTFFERVRAVNHLTHLSNNYDIVVSAMHLITDQVVYACQVINRLRQRHKAHVAMVHTRLSTLLALYNRPGKYHRVRYLYPRFDRVITVGQGVKEDLEELCGTMNNVEVIRNPLDHALILEKARDTLDDAFATAPFFVNVARMDALKDQRTLLNAYRQFTDVMGPTQHLVILGDGALRADLEAQCQELGLSTVHFLGYVDNPWKYVARATALLSTSLLEGLPLNISEAMLCGTPVIATDCPCGPAELLENGAGGYLCEPGDAAAFARAMVQVTQHPEEAREKAAHASRFAAQFALPAVAKQYISTFQEVLSLTN